jgi:hypothetical protein
MAPHPPSGRLYSAITKHWPRIAAGLVAILGISELALGGLTADRSLEYYLTAWAAVTGGTWFLFETAEKALGDEGRGRVVAWMGAIDVKGGLKSIPAQFAMLFDRVFGARHLSRFCFVRSCTASMASLFLVYVLAFALGSRLVLPDESNSISFLVGALAIVGFGGIANFVPDYVSLLQTRWAIEWMQRSSRTWLIVGLDLIATTFLSVIGMWVVYVAVDGTLSVSASLADYKRLADFSDLGSRYLATLFGMVSILLGREVQDPIVMDGIFGSSNGLLLKLSFLSAFFTSAWLWLYHTSVAFSSVLVRMNSGIGVLLRATDVERQPFRSMGFVSVIVLSILFAIGLPFVLLLPAW